MIVAESLGVRRWIGRLERGDRLPAAFLDFARAHEVQTGWISAIGAFEYVDVCEYDQGTQEYKEAVRVDACEVLSLKGNLSFKDERPFAHLHAVVSKEREGGVDVIGGHLIEAQVFALEFHVEAHQGIELSRERDDATGLDLWAEGSQTVGSDAPTELTWELAAALSEEADRRSHPAGPGIPARGDWIEHPKFGLCRIEGLGQDQVMIIKLPDARRKKIKADRLEYLEPRRDGNRTIYPVRPKTR